MASVSLLLYLCVGVWSASASVIPRGYRLDLYPYPGDGVFKGRVRIDLVHPGAGQGQEEGPKQIQLQADPFLNIIEKELTITRLAETDSSEEEEIEGEQASLSVTKVERQNQTLSVHLSHVLQQDATYQLDMQFDGILGPDSTHAFFQSSYVDQTSGEKRWFVALNLKPYRARYVFPCFDSPEIKTWIELSVAHKTDFHILSSMPVTDTTNVTHEGIWVREHFSRTPPMSVNSLALFVSEFPQPISNNYLQTDGIRVGVWGRSDFTTALSKAQQLLPTVMVSLEIYLSRPYPLPQLNLVALPGFTDDTPINAWGLQLFKESDLMNGNTFWLTQRLAKAAALQWLNHLTSPNSSSSCVTAGLANFLATTITQQLEQQNVYHWHLGGLQSLYLEYGKPKSSYMNSIQKEALCASKVQIFFSMMDIVLTPQTFKTGIQNFLSKKEFKMYTDEEVWAAITDQAHQEGTLNKTITVKDIAQSWLGRDRLPILTVTRNYQKNMVVIFQEQFVNHLESQWTAAKVVKKAQPPAEYWWVPIIILKEPDTEEPITNLTNHLDVRDWMRPDHQELRLEGFTEGSKYIVLNPGSIGPFLVNYDPENWRLLGLKITSLPESVRSQLLHDALTLALAGQLETTIALNMTLFLRKEQSAVVWKTFYPLADRLRKQFQGTAAIKPLDEYVCALVTPVLEALGEETDKTPAWKTDFRTKTRHLLCAADHPTCVEHAQGHYARWMESKEPDSGMPLAGSLLCSVFAHGTQEEWEFGMQRLMNFPANRSNTERSFLLKSLAGCSRDADQYERLLNTTLLDDITNQTFSEADKFATLTAMSADTQGCQAMLNFLQENWKPLKKRLSNNLWEYLIQAGLGKFRTEEGLAMVTQLMAERKGQFGTAEKIAEEALEAVKAQVKWTEENCGPVESWLNQTMSKPWPPHRFKFQDILILARTRKFGK